MLMKRAIVIKFTNFMLLDICGCMLKQDFLLCFSEFFLP